MSSQSLPVRNVNGSSNGDTQTVHDERTVPPMGMTSDQFNNAATEAIQDITNYYDNITDRPVLPSVEPGYLAKLLPTSPPTQAETWDKIRADIESKIMPGMTHWQSPDFMAFFPASSSYPGMMGELWSAALTVPAFNWLCSPAVTELETIVMDWVAQMLALPECFLSKGKGGGVIQGSASEAIVTCMVSARERYVTRTLEKEGVVLTEEQKEDRSAEIRSKLVALATKHTHSSTHKGANIAGTRFRSIDTSLSNAFALQGHELRSTIEKLKSQGLEPYFLTVSLGTTNTCAVDDFASIAEVKKDYPDIWIHVDAAYAGVALVLPEYQHYCKHFSTFDSFNTNMHKWLLTNFDASCLFVQNRRDLTDALSITPAYLRNNFSDQGLVTDYRDWQIPLGRRFRALKVWFVIRTWGVQGLQAHIKHHLKLSHLFVDLVKSRSDLFTIVTPPSFALAVITVNPTLRHHAPKPATTEPQPDAQHTVPYQDSHVAVIPQQPTSEMLELANANTKKVYEKVDQSKKVFLTSSLVGDAYAIRVVSANPLASEQGIRKVFGLLVEAAEEEVLEVGK
ncbi:dopa decarboxylase-like protein, partial [Aureobasidium melanogenum]